jgi:L,D-transpeptidase ErfK/SrfK
MTKKSAKASKYFMAGLLFCFGPSNAVFADTFPLPPAGTHIVGQIRVAIARYEDTLLDIARSYDLGYKEITEANPGVDPWLPGAGTRVVLPTQFILPAAPRMGIVLNLSEMRLFYYPAPKPGKQPVVITHPIGIGRPGWDTPIGVSKVAAKLLNPVWRVPPSIRAEHARDGDLLPKVVLPGPDNPLGRFAMRLSIPSYLIHGTNKPYGIGMRVSHGCVHLYPEDIAHVFHQIPIGTPVRIVNQPYLAGWLNGTLYLKAHKPEKHRKLRENRLTTMVSAVIKETESAGTAIDWDRATRIATQGRGIPVPISLGSPDLGYLLIVAPEVESSAYSSAARNHDALEAAGGKR